MDEQSPKSSLNPDAKYVTTIDQILDIENRFTYHTPKEGQNPRYEAIRFKARELSEMLLMYTPKSREQSLALTKLEEAVMWANASIARHE